jgi:hypothetical protein
MMVVIDATAASMTRREYNSRLHLHRNPHAAPPHKEHPMHIHLYGNFRDLHTVEWAGTGTVDADGTIDCTADLDPEIYEHIEDAIRRGETSGTVTRDDLTYEWSLED